MRAMVSELWFSLVTPCTLCKVLRVFNVHAHFSRNRFQIWIQWKSPVWIVRFGVFWLDHDACCLYSCTGIVIIDFYFHVYTYFDRCLVGQFGSHSIWFDCGGPDCDNISQKKNEITLEYSIIIVVSRLDFNHIEMLFISYDHWWLFIRLVVFFPKG